MGTDEVQPERPRLLACVSTSPHGPSVLRGAAEFAESLGAETTYLHVGDDSPNMRSRLVEVLASVGVGVSANEILIRGGRPEAVICEAARQCGADLIVAGALEQESVLREWLGSTARRVARRAPCSVLLVVQNIDKRPPWRRVVASVEYDDASRELLAWLACLARSTPSMEFHFIYEGGAAGSSAFESLEDRAGESQPYRNVRAAAENFRMVDFLEPFDFGAAHVEKACISGRAGESLLRYAAGVQAELIATRAPGAPLGVWDRFFNHPAERVLQRLPCSVLIHRQRLSNERESAS